MNLTKMAVGLNKNGRTVKKTIIYYATNKIYLKQKYRERRLNMFFYI